MLLSKVKGTYNLRTRRPIRPNPLIPMADMVGQFRVGLRSESCQRSSSQSARIIATRFRAGFCSCHYREGISRKLPVGETFSQFGARGPEGVAQTCQICGMMGNHIEGEF